MSTSNTATKPQTQAEKTNQALQQLNEAWVKSQADDATLVTLQKQIKALTEQLEQCQSSNLKHMQFNPKAKALDELLPYSPATGKLSPIAPYVEFSYDNQQKKVLASVNCGYRFQGPANTVHGAVISSIYDQILAFLTVTLQKGGPTAYLHINFFKPTPINEDLKFSAQLEKIDGKKLWVKGQCHFQGELLSEAEGLFIQYVP